MTYFELVIACFIGSNVQAFLPEGLVWVDNFALACQKIAMIMCILFPIIIVAAIWLKTKKNEKVFDEEVI